VQTGGKKTKRMLEDEQIFNSLNENGRAYQPPQNALTYISRIECMQAAIQIQMTGEW
jgi:hypothetical protein